MSLPDFSVRRPVTVLVSTVAVTIFGLLASQQLPVELLPDLSYPSLTVQTEYPDAAPLSVEQFVTRPIEEVVGVIPGLREMRSVSRSGLSEVVLEFDWDQPMDFAAMEVREKYGLAEIPREAERPRVLRFDPALDPIMRLALAGERPLDELRQIAERWLKPRLEAVQGVAAAKVRGGLDPEIQVEASEDRLAALGLTLDDLAIALRAENVNQPGGTLKDWGAIYLVRTLHEFEDLDQLRRTVVRETPAGRVRVEDVATVWRGHRDREEITRSGGQEVVEIALHREGSSNVIAVAEAIREELHGPPGRPELGLLGQLSDGLSVEVLSDQSLYISAAISQVWGAAVVGGLLAILVLYFFLGDLRATAIIAVSIPVSVVATFLPLYRAGVTLNIMSLGGLALGVGMLVDNSIVVLESIDRHLRAGGSRRGAAARGGREVASAVTAATLTTVAVFVPIVFVQGVAGQLFYDLAMTVCLSLLASLFVSLTLIPMLAAIEPSQVRRIATADLLRGHDAERPRQPGTRSVGPMVFPPLVAGGGLAARVLNALTLPFRVLLRALLVLGLLYPLKLVLFLAAGGLGVAWWLLSSIFNFVTWPLRRLMHAVSEAYPLSLSRALRLRWVVLPLALGLFVVALQAVPRLGTDLVPDLAQGEFAFRLKLTEGSTLDTSAQIVEQVERRMVGDPLLARVYSVIGSLPSSASGRQTRGENLAQINFTLHEGATTADELRAVARARQVLDLFPAVEAELVHPSVLSVRPPVAINVFSEDLDALDHAAAATAAMLGRIPGVVDIGTTSEPGNPEITIELDRDRAAALGVRAEPLALSLRRQIRGEVVGTFREEAERLDIRLRATEDARRRATQIEQLRFRLADGTAIPVAAVAAVSLDRGPAAIYRNHGTRVAEVTAKVSSADLGGTLVEVRQHLAGLALPPGVVAEAAGQDEELKVSFDSLRLALALAIFMVYVVMAVQFESFRYPLVILLSVPLGVVGVIAALFLTGTSISVLVLIGGVMLAGIVVNNAIVLVDAVNRRRGAGEALEAAIVGAGRERLRPILMTTATTVLGLLPLALGVGAGAELRRPMAITVIGGLTAATLLTLVVIPCLYHVFTRAPSRTAAAAHPALVVAREPVEEAS